MVTLALREWGDRWDASGFGAPTVETIDTATGRPLRLALVDAETGQAVPARRAGLQPGPGADAHTRKREPDTATIPRLPPMRLRRGLTAVGWMR